MDTQVLSFKKVAFRISTYQIRKIQIRTISTFLKIKKISILHCHLCPKTLSRCLLTPEIKTCKFANIN